MSSAETPNLNRQAEWTAVVAALVFPSIMTWAYFVWLADGASSITYGVYGVGKALQFAFPLIWVVLVLRQRPRLHPPDRRGVPLGLAFGGLVLAAMLGLYFFWLKPAGFFEQGAGEQVREKIASLKLDRLWAYVACSVFYSLLHSLAEEYYWRWFVFGRMRLLVSLPVAVIVSSLGFMAHHIILLSVFFGWFSPAAILFSLAVAIGGAAWACLYHLSRSLYGPWWSHLLVDAGIFLIGYDLARDLFSVSG